VVGLPRVEKRPEILADARARWRLAVEVELAALRAFREARKLAVESLRHLFVDGNRQVQRERYILASAKLWGYLVERGNRSVDKLAELAYELCPAEVKVRTARPRVGNLVVSPTRVE
jgi:hypothetical protein